MPVSEIEKPAVGISIHELSSVQQVIWVDQMTNPDVPNYIIGMAIRLDGAMDADVLRNAINLVANRHDALRINMLERDGIPGQCVLPSIQVGLKLVDFSGVENGEAKALAHLQNAFSRPFNLIKGMLWDSQLVRVHDTCYYWMSRFHHLVVDAIGVGLYGHAVAATYNGQLENKLDCEPAPSYLDFLEEDRAYLSSSRFARDRTFWCERYAHLPAPLFERTSGHALNVISPSGHLRWWIKRSLYDRLTSFATAHGHSMAHVLHAAFSTYFARTQGCEEVVIGMPVHNRTTAKSKKTVGLFSSVSPIGVTVEGNRSFLDLMNEVAAELRCCYRHQRFPIAELNRTLKLAQIGRRQLFDVTLSFESLDGDDVFGEAPCTTLAMNNGYEQNPLAVFVRDYFANTGRDVMVDFHYNKSILQECDVQRIQEHIALLLERIEEHFDTPVNRLPLLSDAERQQVLFEFNDVARSYPQDLLVHQLFESMALARPDAIAVSCEGAHITYATLNARANQLAHRLIESGVRPDDRVAVCLERSIEMVISLLAVLKAGGAYVPLDPSLPKERLGYMLQDSGSVALLTIQSLQGALAQQSLPFVLWLDAEADELATWPEHNPDPVALGLGARHLAYVLYTSGSTGQPKGVMNEHRGVVNRLLWARDEFKIEQDDVVLQKTPFGFDVSVWEFFLPLLVGAKLVMARPQGHLDPVYLSELISQDQVTTVHFVPSMLSVFLEQGSPRRCASLRRVLCSGEALPYALQQRFFEVFPKVDLSNLYGPTEAAIDVTCWHCTTESHPGLVPIGRPVANTQIHVLDAQLQPVPLGCVGEIHIGGVQVARGYLNRAELTAERFIEDPFSALPDARLYKTGDIGRWLPDGAIEYLGRNDHQVKLRGFRIELGEIEAQLAACPDIRETVVLALESSDGDKHLVAYYTGASQQPEALKTRLQAALPAYMVPTSFVWLPALPLNANGKLDRKALPAPDVGALPTRAYEPPHGELETLLASLWQEMLGIERIGRHDEFFELGGHSLQAVRLLARLRDAHGIDLPLRDLFANPSLAGAAQALLRAPRILSAPIEHADRSTPLPLSTAQQRLWFLDRFDPAAGMAYHMAAGLRLRGTLNREALQAALDRVVARHESLRTSFPTVDGQPVQHVGPLDAGFPLLVQDLTVLASESQADAEARVADEEASAPFNLATGPLTRGRLLRLGEEEHVLLFTQHHIVSDGWSIAVFVREFNALYAAFSLGQADPLPALPIQYADYAAWQRSRLNDETLRTQTTYWLERLRGAPALLELPSDRPRPAQQSYAGGSVRFALTPSLSEGLRRLGQEQGATLFMTMLTGWAALLSRLSGQSEVVIGTPIANRQHAKTEDLIGFFVNTLAMRVPLHGAPSVAMLLKDVRELSLDAYAHQELPFELVVEALRPVRSPSHSPIFQSMLVLDNTPQEGSVQLPGLSVTALVQDRKTTQFDLSLIVRERGDVIEGEVEYASDLFDHASAERIVGYLTVMLEGMVADSGRSVAALPLLDDAQRQRVLSVFNNTQADYPAGLVHQWFEQQALVAPDAPAIQHEGHIVSYGELNRQANQLAHRLRQLDVRPDQRVGLMVERGPAMVAGMLAILKAGGAYVPLDPGYPGERIDHMLQDSAPMALLTTHALRSKVGAGLPVLLLDDDHASMPEHDPDSFEIGLNARHLAYVMYTSGSTGKPKGVMVEHRGVVNQIAGLHRRYGLTPQDRVLQFASMAFDMSVEEIFGALLSGATLVMRSDEWIASPSEFCRRCGEAGVTVANLPTVFWQQLIRSASLQLPASLRQLMIGGEAVGRHAIATWFARPEPRPKVFNAYGPTEATVNACIHEMVGSSVDERSIGQPVANTKIYVLDPLGQPVPVGVAGEIHIGGVGVTRGYLNRPELSAERFLSDPFAGSADARMYRTGDRGRWRTDGHADGYVEYLGRDDDQVKIRGFRIELGEVEAALAAVAGIREAVVVVREDMHGEKRLAAYYTGKVQTPEALRTMVQASLPEYMVPAAYVHLDALPLTPNGKLDRQALPAPGLDALATHAYEAPRNEAEATMARVWQNLLGVERVGRHDHFFELGGHSLLAVSMVEQLREAGLRIDVRKVFATPVLCDLVACVDREKDDATLLAPLNRIGSVGGIAADVETITPDLLPLVALSQAEIDCVLAQVPQGVSDVQDVYPLTPLQEGMLFHHLLGGEGDAYLVRSILSFDTRERLDAFLAALQEVIDRHDILRTSFHWEGLPQPLQVVHRHAQLPVQTVALTQADEPLAQLRRHCDPRALRLDVRRAPLLAAWIAPDPGSSRWHLSLLDHHLISDHVSLELILAEVRTILSGQACGLPAPVPYRNLVAHIQAAGTSAHEAYFRSRLSDVDEPTAPYGLLDVRGDGAGVAETQMPLPPALAERVRDVSRKCGVSGASIFHLAWALVVARTANRDDLVFGTVMSGRAHGDAGAQGAMGMFINTLPIRIDLTERSAAQALREVHKNLSELLEHEHAPLALAQRCSSLDADTPLFTSLLNYRHSQFNMDATGNADWEGVSFLANEARTNFPLEAAVSDHGQDYTLTIQAMAGIDPTHIAAYFCASLEGLTQALTLGGQQAVQDIDILPEGEQSLLRSFNATHQPFPTWELLHRLFEARAAAQPDAVAVIEQHTKPNARLTFAQLNRLANQLAQRLIDLGAGPDQRIAICTERSAHMVVAVLAVLKSGAAYVPLDPAQPAERIAALLADSSPLAWVTHTALREHLSPATLPPLPRLELDGLDDPGAAFDANPDVPGLTDRHLAYIIYTSGSTGQAKGVMVEHRSVVNFWRVLGLSTHRHVPPHATVALNAGFFFDMSIKGLSQLLSGHTLVLIPQALRASGTELLDFLAEHRVHAFDSTPSQLEGLLEAGLLKRADYQPISVLLGGEPIPAPTWHKLRHSPVTRFYNMYGPTECTVDATIGLISELGERPSIGRPIANLSVYVLDARQRPVPLGVAGEIYVGGMGVARGYLNRPDLTAERFVSDPFDAAPNARMYKTGDLARYRPEGTLEYLGRNDAQLKIRGFRIEPGEIESRLRAQPDVREAIVLARQDQDAPARLVAYLVPRDGAQLQAASLRAALAKHLPEYMIPSAFVVLDRLPLNANGKLDRAALPVPALEHLATSQYEAPQGDTEQAIAQIWQQLLGVERVGRHDRFFDLGGHSLLAMQLITRLHQGLGVQLPLAELFVRPVLADLAAHVAGLTQTALPPIEQADRSTTLPLSLAQQRLWFLDRLDRAAGAAYHMPAGLRLEGRLDRTALQSALDRIVARHESLRTTFLSIDGQPVQRIAAPTQGFPLVYHDLRALDTQSRAAAAARLTEEEVHTPFDLSVGPLARGRLLQMADDQHWLLITQHHIVSDGWSLSVLVREFGALYTSIAKGEPDPLKPLALQYADYAAWQRKCLQGEALREHTAYWRKHLDGAPALLELPTDRRRPAQQSYEGASHLVTLPALLVTQLRQMSQRHGVTMFMTLLAGWSALLARLSGQDDIVVGTPVANRSRAETEELIGFFVNTLALRVSMQDAPSTAQLLCRVRELTLAAFAHQELPFEQVVEAVQPVRSLGHSPLFQSMLTLGNTPHDRSLALPQLSVSELPQPQHTTQFDLSLSLYDAGETLQGRLEYATDLFDATTIARIGEHLQTLLEGMVADPERPLGALPLLSAAQYRQVVVDFNANGDVPLTIPPLNQWLENQAARAPDAVAVVCGDRALTHAQLHAQANRLAHHLIALGVSPDDRIGLCVERCPEMVVGLLAILKAGAAYVPLDPSYPDARLAHMLADCRPKLVLAQTHTQTRATLGEVQVPTLLLDDDAPYAHHPIHAPNVPGLSPHHLAYVIYTSGSTGVPKGAQVERRGLQNLLAWYLHDLDLSADDAVLLLSSHSFDLTQKNILGPLLAGACLHLAPAGFDPNGLVEQIQRERITHINLSPSAFHALVDAGAAQLSGLKRVVLGGEPINAAKLAALPQPRPQFINSYGPTECSDVVAWERLADNLDCYRHATVPIGRPIRNLRLYILDATSQPVPIGVVGEIHIGGLGVGRGYLNQASSDNPRFVADPFTDDPAARMYRSGDLGRWLPDGRIEYLGRGDTQIKLRGFRIELGEIEASLASVIGEGQGVAVTVREDVPGEQRLVAYYTGAQQAPDFLRAQLLNGLPEHMVPAAYVRLDRLPLNPNGKLDRRALPQPDHDAMAMRPYEAPSGQTESLLADIWQALLGLDQVGRGDHFFELGGHSLMVVKLIDRLCAHGLRANVRDVFAAPRLADMAAIITARVAAPSPSMENGTSLSYHIPQGCLALTSDMLPLAGLRQDELDRIVASVPGGAPNVQDIYPLSPLQEGILFHHLLDPEADAYVARSVLSFDDRGRLDAFLSALQQVIDRHDILRSGIRWQGLSHAVQVVHRQATLPIHTLTLPATELALDALLERTDPRRTRIDLRKAPLLAAYIAFDPASGHWLLSLLNHHMVSDHLTLELVLAEIQAILGGDAAKLQIPLPYRDFIAFMRTDSTASHERYFKGLLGDVDEPTAAFGLLDVQGDGATVAQSKIDLSADLARRTRQAARRHGVTTAALFHLTWAQVLARCSGRDDVVFGSVLSGRLQGIEGVGRALGVFINTLPVRLKLGEQGVSDLMGHTHRQLIELLQHEQASLALAQRCSAVPASMPLFTALLNYRHNADDTGLPDASGSTLAAWRGIRILFSEERSSYPLTLSVEDNGVGLGLTVQAIPPISPERIQGFVLRAVEQMVEALESAPKKPVCQLDVLPAHEREQVLYTWNQTSGSDHAEPVNLAEPLIHHLFEQHAGRTPMATAVVDANDELSYGELNRLANGLANRLTALGAGPDKRVAICMDRGVKVIVALLAVLKAGAAYVPIDPAYPAERLGQILVDSNPVLLLSDALGREALGDAIGDMARLDLDTLPKAGLREQNLNPANIGLRGEHLAYVIYTSGSTGRPKGVMIEHRSLVASTAAREAVYGASHGRRFMLLSSIAFDSSVAGIFGTLSSGGALHLPSQADVTDPQTIARTIAQQGITSLLCVPSLARLVLADLAVHKTGTLREMIVAGEACPPALVQEAAAHPGLALYNEYGPTEATVWATVHKCSPDEHGQRQVPAQVPIGRPIQGTRIYLLDQRGQPVPVGVAGELYIGGAGVARGYLNAPALTEIAFLPDPFDAQPGVRMYRTGDLAKHRPDGVLDFLGRNDDQVKIRGFRIEPGEIEARLVAHPEVHAAAVVAREDIPGEARLVAYVVLVTDVIADGIATRLRAELEDELPPYMLPAAYVVLNALPLSPNGKLDRKALPAPQGEAYARQHYEAPRQGVEQVLAGLWSDLLAVDQVSRHDRFFELGGHSLLAIQLATRVRETFGVELSLKVLFERPSLEALADLITSLQLASYEAQDLAALEQELQNLSEEELLARLAEDSTQ